MKEDQRAQALRFREANDAQVAGVEKLMVEAVLEFLDIHGLAVLGSSVLQAVREDLDSGECERYAGRLRTHAVAFDQAGLSSPYWNLIDALQFFSDAVGSHWPYMSERQRTQSLTWVVDDTTSLRKWMANRQQGSNQLETAH